MKKIIILLVLLNLTACRTQRAWFLDSMADGLDPQPQIEQSTETTLTN